MKNKGVVKMLSGSGKTLLKKDAACEEVRLDPLVCLFVCYTTYVYAMQKGMILPVAHLKPSGENPAVKI